MCKLGERISLHSVIQCVLTWLEVCFGNEWSSFTQYGIQISYTANFVQWNSTCVGRLTLFHKLCELLCVSLCQQIHKYIHLWTENCNRVNIKLCQLSKYVMETCPAHVKPWNKDKSVLRDKYAFITNNLKLRWLPKCSTSKKVATIW